MTPSLHPISPCSVGCLLGVGFLAVFLIPPEAAPCGTGHPEGMSAASVLAKIEQKGPSHALDALFYDEHAWRQIHAGIASGEAQWLEVGVKLSAAADGGASYDLNLAFGEALAQHPLAVLERAPNLEASCGNMDQPYLQDRGAALREVARRQAKVRSVQRVDLQKRRDVCLAQLDQLRARVPSFFPK